MLESLDTLIAFIVIMSVASLLVTIVVQTISAGFSLRGLQLLRGLQNAGNVFAPGAMKVSKELADALLRKPNLVGWNKLAGAVRPDEIYDTLKKLAAVSDDQFGAAEVAATDARTAANTKKNEVSAFAYDAPTLEGKIEQARAAVVSAKAKAELAAAIQADKDALATKTGELEKLEDAKSLETKALQLEADLVLLKKYRDDSLSTGAIAQNSDLSAEAARLLASLMPETQKSAAIREALGSVVEQIDKTCIPTEQRKAFDAAIQQASRQLIDQVDSLKAAVEQWFNSAVDRAQEWFLGWIRVITIAIGVLMAFVCQWDAVEIFKQVSGPNNALRDALVKQAPVVLEKKGNILEVSQVGGGLLERLKDAWNKAYEPAIPNLDGVKTVVDLENRLTALAKSLEEKETAQAQTEANKGKKADEKATEAEVNNKRLGIHREAVEAAKALKPAKDLLVVNDVKTKFDLILTTEVKNYISTQQEAFIALSHEVSVAGFEFFPKDGWRWKDAKKVESSKESHWYDKFVAFWDWVCEVVSYYRAQWLHIPGMLIFAALLGLGAPFWFNLLKNLSNLRPALAKLLDANSDKAASTSAQ